MHNFQRLTLFQRRLIFFLIVIGVLFLLAAITLLLASSAINASARQMAQALVPEAAVSEFAQLPDDDAYPAAVAAAPDGSMYTGSFASGAVWRIAPDGEVTEIVGARSMIGSVSGITVTGDGALLILDVLDIDVRTGGGALWRIDLASGEIVPFGAEPDGAGWISPNDITVDAQGRVYVSDLGRNEVWRYEADGSAGAVWWVPPVQVDEGRPAVTGLAYDPPRDAIIITDSELNHIYRVPVAGGETELVYRHGERANPPGFDGATVTPEGDLYVAALGQNGIALVRDNDLDYIAGLFRGASDVEFSAPNRLIVPNFDQASLIVPLLRPQLPFAVDVIELVLPSA